MCPQDFLQIQIKIQSKIIPLPIHNNEKVANQVYYDTTCTT